MWARWVPLTHREYCAAEWIALLLLLLLLHEAQRQPRAEERL
jgi:hypothetical protein